MLQSSAREELTLCVGARGKAEFQNAHASVVEVPHGMKLRLVAVPGIVTEQFGLRSNADVILVRHPKKPITGVVYETEVGHAYLDGRFLAEVAGTQPVTLGQVDYPQYSEVRALERLTAQLGDPARDYPRYVAIAAAPGG